ADREATERVLSLMMRKIHGPRAFVKPFVVMHLEQQWKDRITDAELFFLFSALDRSGSRVSRIWIGRELTEGELLRRHFPDEGVLFLAGKPPNAGIPVRRPGRSLSM